MEEILHQLIWRISRFYRWCRISSINSMGKMLYGSVLTRVFHEINPSILVVFPLFLVQHPYLSKKKCADFSFTRTRRPMRVCGLRGFFHTRSTSNSLIRRTRHFSSNGNETIVTFHFNIEPINLGNFG